MKLDTERIDQAVLAMLPLGLYEGTRAWKAFDLGRHGPLHEKGYLSDPHGKAKNIGFTELGLNESQRLLNDLFGARHD